MIEVKLFEGQAIYNLDFIPNRDLFPVVIIAPNPQSADEIRQQIIKTGMTKIPDVITVSKFVKDQLAFIFNQPKLLNKAKLLLNGASLWKFYLGEKIEKQIDQELFFKAFNLFTELRGYSLDSQLIYPILNEYPEDLRGFIQYFYQIMQDLDYMDEHKAYREIAEHYRQIDVNYEMKTYVFWDFLYLSGSQIDMINALSVRNQVVIPYDLEIYHKSISSDWIRWFLPKSNLIPTTKSIVPLRVVEFPKKKLNLHLKKLASENKTDILLCSKKISEYEIFDLPFDQYFFKTSNSIFENEVQLLQNKLLELTKTNPVLKTSELSQLIGNELTILLKDKNKKFRRIKVLTDFIQLLEEYYHLSNYNHSLNDFDFKVLFEVLSLNLPRTFFSPVVDKNKGQLLDLSRIKSLDSSSQVFVCAHSDLAPIKMAEDIYPEKVFEMLSTLGPVKRNGLDFLVTQKKLQEVLRLENTVLLIENNLSKHDLGWSEILRSFKLEKLSLPRINQESSKLKFDRKGKVTTPNSISPTRLQSFLDCPQKYYYQYIEKLNVDLDLKTTIQNNEIGTIEHKVIETYLKAFENLDEGNLHKTTVQVLDQFLLNENRHISKIDYNHLLTEVKLFSRQAISYLLNLKEIDPKVHFEFEKELRMEFHDLNLNASIDCIIYFSKGYAILDFKRSESSIPSKKEILDFEKIQILFYLKFLFEKNDDVLFYGYLNLNNLQDSLLLNHNADFYEIYNNLNFPAKLSVVKNDLNQLMTDFSSRLEDLCRLLKEEKNYFPSPIQDKVCRFCILKSVCPRQEVVNV
jgi:RecB family exonuclease